MTKSLNAEASSEHERIEQLQAHEDMARKDYFLLLRKFAATVLQERSLDRHSFRNSPKYEQEFSEATAALMEWALVVEDAGWVTNFQLFTEQLLKDDLNDEQLAINLSREIMDSELLLERRETNRLRKENAELKIALNGSESTSATTGRRVEDNGGALSTDAVLEHIASTRTAVAPPNEWPDDHSVVKKLVESQG